MRAFAENPLEFMSSCIVIVMYAGDNPGKRRFTLEPFHNYHVPTQEYKPVVGSRLGQPLPVYKLSEAGYNVNYFEAFWCPFQKNQANAVNLDNTADFFFTATMDGCSLGIGSTAIGCVRVAHANAGGLGHKVGKASGIAAGKAAQRRTQQAMLLSRITGPMEIVRPATYMTDLDLEERLKSTTFGVRRGVDNWEVYCQQYERRSAYRMFLRNLVRVV